MFDFILCLSGYVDYVGMFIYQCHDVIRGGLRLSPATFTCESPCVVPTVANAAGGGVCKEAP